MKYLLGAAFAIGALVSATAANAWTTSVTCSDGQLVVTQKGISEGPGGTVEYTIRYYGVCVGSYHYTIDMVVNTHVGETTFGDIGIGGLGPYQQLSEKSDAVQGVRSIWRRDADGVKDVREKKVLSAKEARKLNSKVAKYPVLLIQLPLKAVQ